jgi:hypothetical protein
LVSIVPILVGKAMGLDLILVCRREILIDAWWAG